MSRLSLLLLLWLAVPAAAADNQLQPLLQALDYIAVDYPGAVRQGQVVNAGEYREMQEFAGNIAEQAASLPANSGKAALVDKAKALLALVSRRGSEARLAALAGEMRQLVISRFGVVTVPRRAPDLARARHLYSQNCAMCHGTSGHADGPRAAALQPPPINFHDHSRAAQRSVFGLYNTISLGVPDTAMRGFAGLSEDDRWALAFLVAGWGTPQAKEAGAAPSIGRAPADLESVANLSPNEVSTRFGSKGLADFSWLRTHPGQLFRDRPSGLALTRQELAVSLERYRAGDRKAAYQHAVSAYLEGFEPLEATLNVSDPALREQIERAMTHFRGRVHAGAPIANVEAAAAAIRPLLHRAEAVLADHTMSTGEAFSGALVILLREGLEAVLVVAALAAFLVKTGRRDGMKYLHTGWIGALILGGLTWWAAGHLVTIGGAGRELTEGVAALVAAVVLFYVGFWLHSKTAAGKWKQFIEGSVSRALTSSTLWSLAGLSFIAVYREVFETILFYQALWLQSGESGHGAVLAGVAAGAVGLLVLIGILVRTSTRLPLRQFFGVTGMFMLVLAVIFAGKGIAAIQEAGKLPVSPVELLPRIDLLGIYPDLQSFGLQLIMVAAGAFLLYRQRSGRRPAA